MSRTEPDTRLRALDRALLRAPLAATVRKTAVAARIPTRCGRRPPPAPHVLGRSSAMCPDDDAPVIPRIPRPRKPLEPMTRPPGRPIVPPQAPPGEK